MIFPCMLNKVFDTSVHTTQVCSQDFYEDGVKRDRLQASGRIARGFYPTFDGNVARFDSSVELVTGQRIAIRPWSFATDARVGVPFPLVVP